MRKEYLAYVTTLDNDYVALWGHEDFGTVMDFAITKTQEAGVSELLIVGSHNHPDEDEEDGAWLPLAIVFNGEVIWRR